MTNRNTLLFHGFKDFLISDVRQENTLSGVVSVRKTLATHDGIPRPERGVGLPTRKKLNTLEKWERAVEIS